ncbi:MAG: hypothetical protein LUE06_08840 [Oscillospiraceae bacterium]|nr:hypothetical protein [Oscillospiraceae bacterium]
MNSKPILKRGFAIVCSTALVFSLAGSAFAAEPEDVPEKIVVGMVVDVTEDEVTLEVREAGRGGMGEAAERLELREMPEGEFAEGEQPNTEPVNGAPTEGAPLNNEMRNERFGGELTLAEGMPTSEKPENEAPPRQPETEPEEGETPPELPEIEPEEGAVPPELPETELEEGAVPPAEPELEGESSTLVLSVDDLNGLEPEAGDMLCVVYDADGEVVSAELMQMNAAPIKEEKEAE